MFARVVVRSSIGEGLYLSALSQARKRNKNCRGQTRMKRGSNIILIRVIRVNPRQSLSCSFEVLLNEAGLNLLGVECVVFHQGVNQSSNTALRVSHYVAG